MSEAAIGWSDFFVAEVGASAALSGLVIVAISINLQRILSFPHLPGRAAEMLIMLVGALLACSVALVPDQSAKLLGAEIAGIGLFMTGAPIFIQVCALMTVKNQPVSWWLWRLLLALCAGLPILIGGAFLIGGTGGLYWVAAGVLVTLAATIWNSWVLLVEILR
jgi:hypothetical protein